MGMNIDSAQARISRELVEAEQAVDDALIKQSLLFTSIVSARRDLGLASTTGQEALMRLSKSQQSLLSAVGDLARVHGQMLVIVDDIRGDLASPPPGCGGQQTKTGQLAAA
jgi:hypothetical protein